jgi:hypothetical protein
VAIAERAEKLLEGLGIRIRHLQAGEDAPEV